MDIDEEAFQAEVPFKKADLNLPLTQQVESFDIIIAMEVLKHLRTPYLMLEDIYQTLNPGGHFLFSVPNIHNLLSRIKFLTKGTTYKYHLPSADSSDAHSTHGHISPFSIQYWDYGLRYAGFSDIHYSTDRFIREALIWAALLSPLL